MPVPLAAPWAWKKRSNTCVISSRAMPFPVSFTSMRNASGVSASQSETNMLPPDGVYFKALLRRLNTIRATFSLSAMMVGEALKPSVLKWSWIFLRSAVSRKSSTHKVIASTILKRLSVNVIFPFCIFRKSRIEPTSCCKANALRFTIPSSSLLRPLIL